MMTAKDNTDKGDPGVVNPAFVVEDLDSVDVDKEETSSRRSDGDGMSDTDSVSSNASTSSAPGISKFNLKMSPRPLRRSHRRSLSQQHSPESYRSSYQSNRSSVCSTRKGILKKTASSTTINMEMANISQPQTPTDNGHTPRLSDAFDDNCSNGDISRFSRSTDDVPLHHQRSFNRVKFILDSGRPDNVTGDYDDIKMEKNDRNLSMDRGKSTEKDNSGLSKSGRRCLLFTAGLLVLTMAVILGSLFGSRKLSNIPIKSIISPLDDKLIRNAIEGRFKITNKDFIENLHNYESEEFKKMSKDLEALISKVIYHEATQNLINSTVNLRIIKILKGSLVPIFRVKWEEKDQLSDDEIRKRIMRHLDKFGSIGEYKVDKTSVSVADLQNNCHKSVSADTCSHTCVFSHQTLRFLCRCPDTLVLTNNTICTSPQQTTRKMPFLVPPVVNNIIKDSGAQFHSVNPETVEKKKSEDIVLETPVKNPPVTKSPVKNVSTTASTNKVSISSTSKLKPDETSKEKAKVNDINETKPAEENKEDTEKESEIKKEKDKKEDKQVPTKTGDEKIIEDSKIVGEKKKSSSTVQNKNQSEISENESKLSNEVSDVTVTTDKIITKENVETLKTTETEGNKNNSHTTVQKDDKASVVPLIKETATPNKVSSGDELTSSKDQNMKVNESKTEKDDQISYKGDESAETVDAEGNDSSKLNTDSLLSTGENTVTSLEVETIASSSIAPTLNTKINNDETIHNVNETINESEDKMTKTTDVGNNALEDSTIYKIMKGIDNKNKKISDDISKNTGQTETSTRKTDTSVVTGTMETKHSETHANGDGLLNITNITSNHSLLHYNASGSFEDKIVTVGNISIKDNFTISKIPEDQTKSKNATLLGILLPSATKAEVNKTLSPSKEETSKNMTDAETSINTQSITNEVVTVQAEILSEIIKTPSDRSTSPIISVLLGDSSTKALESSTERTKGSNNLPGKPINIGDIADISNILSSGNISSDNKNRPVDIKSVKHTEANVTTSPNTEKEKESVEFAILEEESLCTEDQFHCASGSSRFGICIPKSSRCDSVYDCFDRSDEKDCIANKCFGNYQCWSGDCVQREYVCDGIRHCADGGDEEGCETWKCTEEEFKCQSTKGRICIPSSQRCDGQSDCFDNSDERNCSKDCSSDHFLCPEGWCIPNIWKCDGTSDCAAGEDEKDCECNGLDQSPCNVGGCVPTFKLCDGLRQCPDGSDEYGCLRIDNKTKQLEVRSEEKRWSPVCGDKWTNGWTELVCEQLGFGGAISTEVKRVNESVPKPRVKLSPEAPKVAQRGRAPLQYFLTPGECAAEPLVHVSCKQPSCGKWSRTSTGSPNSENKDPAWPSLGLLIQPGSYEDPSIAFTHSCAATAITPVWVIASYSCLLSRPNGLEAEKWAFLIGETSPKVGQRNTQLRHAKQVVIHPGAKKKNGLWVGDAALLRLQSPLVLDESTSLACLPDKPIGTHSHCKIATWTEKIKLSDKEEGVTQTVQRLPVPNLTTKTCNISYYNGKLDSSHVCASFMQNSHSPCKGKEGSPLMCKSDDGTWQIHGLLSLTSTCARFELPSLFTDISSINQWVMNTVEKKETISPLEMVRQGNTEEGKPIARSLHNTKIQKEVVKLVEEPKKKDNVEEESS